MSGQSLPMPLLVLGAASLGATLTSPQLSQFAALAHELLAWNERVNLTAITDTEEIQVKHFLDSLTPLPLIAEWARGGPATLVDVGAGGGMPGLPLAIALPSLHVTLVESVAKKAAFLQHAIEVLRLSNATTVHGRSEDLARAPTHRERYDLAIARAVGSVATLVELLIPFLVVGGRAVLMKTWAGVAEELSPAEGALLQLEAQLEAVVPVELGGPPGGMLGRRALIVVRKDAPTSARYPRRPGVPQRRPLV